MSLTIVLRSTVPEDGVRPPACDLAPRSVGCRCCSGENRDRHAAEIPCSTLECANVWGAVTETSYTVSAAVRAVTTVRARSFASQTSEQTTEHRDQGTSQLLSHQRAQLPPTDCSCTNSSEAAEISSIDSTQKRGSISHVNLRAEQDSGLLDRRPEER